MFLMVLAVLGGAPRVATARIKLITLPVRQRVEIQLDNPHATLVEEERIVPLVQGVNQVDFSGYPDCRGEYIQAYEEMANLATKAGVEGEMINIETPLLHMTKAEIVKAGMRLEVPYHLTWSCYQGKEKACGVCDSCILRLKGFEQAGFEDPIDYS